MLKDLVERVRCRTLLSTHYHGLLQDFDEDARVMPMHMACRVDPTDKQLVMLYKLQKGVSPQSYGMECGRRAGLPSHIIERARVKSREFEAAQLKRAAESAAEAAAEAAAPKRWRTAGVDGDGPALERARKVRKVLAAVSASHDLVGKDALHAHRRLTELWEEAGGGSA